MSNEPTYQAQLPATLIKSQHTDLAEEFITRLKGLLDSHPEVLQYSVQNDYYKRESLRLKVGSVTIDLTTSNA